MLACLFLGLGWGIILQFYFPFIVKYNVFVYMGMVISVLSLLWTYRKIRKEDHKLEMQLKKYYEQGDL